MEPFRTNWTLKLRFLVALIFEVAFEVVQVFVVFRTVGTLKTKVQTWKKNHTRLVSRLRVFPVMVFLQWVLPLAHVVALRTIVVFTAILVVVSLHRVGIFILLVAFRAFGCVQIYCWKMSLWQVVVSPFRLTWGWGIHFWSQINSNCHSVWVTCCKSDHRINQPQISQKLQFWCNSKSNYFQQLNNLLRFFRENWNPHGTSLSVASFGICTQTFCRKSDSRIEVECRTRIWGASSNSSFECRSYGNVCTHIVRPNWGRIFRQCLKGKWR